MQILHLVPTGKWAGTEVIASGLANYQCRKHRVGVALATSSRFSPSFYRPKFRPDVDLFFIPENVKGAAEQAAWLTRQMPWRPNVMHAHLGPGCRIARALTNWPAVRIASMHIRFYRVHFEGMDAVVGISPWQLRDVPTTFDGRAYQVTNFLTPPPKSKPENVAWFRRSVHADEETFVIGSIGRLQVEKGMDLLIRAYHRAQLDNARLVIIGDGEQRPRLERLAAGDPTILLRGFVDQANSLIPGMDVYVSSARGEPFGLTLLEAMGYGRPIIATATLGASDIFGDRPDVLVPMDDVDALADALRAKAEARESTVRYDLTPFDYEARNGDMLRIYEELVRDVLPGKRAHSGSSVWRPPQRPLT